MNLTSRETAKTIILDYLGETDSNTTLLLEIENILDLSKGISATGIDIYRTYFVIAWKLWLDVNNNIIKAESVEFKENIETVKRLLGLQQMLDMEPGLVIPDIWKVESAFKEVINGNNSKKPSIGLLSF